MSKRVFSHDALTGITKYWHYDAAKDQAIIESVQDVAPILDQNKRERNEGTNEKDHGLGKKVATIPLTMYYQWKAECRRRGYDKDEESAYILGMIKSRDYCHLMTVDKI